MPEDIDPEEKVRFLTLLRRSETGAIVQKLDDNVIIRDWKRELAEAEVQRRGGPGVSKSGGGAVNLSKAHASAELKGWIFTGVLIVFAIVVAYLFIADKMTS